MLHIIERQSMILGKDSIFSYYICKGKEILNDTEHHVRIGDFSVCMSEKTLYEFREEGDISCLIIGVATCLSQDIEGMEWLWRHCHNIESFVEAEKFLGGKYVLILRIKEQYYVMGDATCSIPVFYTNDGDEVLCSCHAYQMANEMHLTPDDTLLKIRESGDSSQIMPYDYTIWMGIKRLLPNHYLHLNEKRAIRIVNHHCKQSALTAEEATEKTLSYTKRLADFYSKKFPVACALTSGRDSRAVLAVLGCNKQMPVYTIKHEEFGENTPDIVVPKLIAEHAQLNYRQFEDIELTDADIAEADTILGKDNYSKRTLMLAHTIKHYLGEKAVINGDIIGQVGKCSLHRDIPQCFATPSYFRCKLHNYSKEAKEVLRLWMQDMDQSDEYVNSFDLFSIENRMGVWAANENEIYNMVGLYYLNIFNSRSIIYEWTRVDRKERKMSAIHLAIIKRLHPELLEIPFEPDGRFEKIAKYNGISYLLASYLKYYIEKIKSRI